MKKLTAAWVKKAEADHVRAVNLAQRVRTEAHTLLGLPVKTARRKKHS